MKTENQIKSSRNQLGRLLRLAALIPALAFLCVGCLAPKSYVDPQFHRATYLSIHAPEHPQPAVVKVTFQFNGKTRKQLQPVVEKDVTKVLAATRVFTEPDPNSSVQPAQLEIVINDVGSVGGAAGKGMLTGFTFGLVGSQVVDGYEMTCHYTPTLGAPITKTYKHAIHSTVGLHAAPKGMQPVPLADAFDQVMQDMLLNFLKDLQDEGYLTSPNNPSAPAATATTQPFNS